MSNIEAADVILLNGIPHSRSEARAILAGPGDGGRESDGDDGDGGGDDGDSGDFPPDMGGPGAEASDES